jgi:hypothetical protein
VVGDCARDEDFEAWEGGDDEGGAEFCCAHDGWSEISTVVSAGG